MIKFLLNSILFAIRILKLFLVSLGNMNIPTRKLIKAPIAVPKIRYIACDTNKFEGWMKTTIIIAKNIPIL